MTILEFTDDQVKAFAARHDFTESVDELRMIISDARSMELLDSSVDLHELGLWQIEFDEGSLPTGVVPLRFGRPLQGENFMDRNQLYFADCQWDLIAPSLVVKLTSLCVETPRLLSTMRRGSE